MPSRTSQALRVAVLADSDTRWKWGALTARRLAPDARIDGMLLRGRATPTPRQLAEVGVSVDSLREVTGAEFVEAAAGRRNHDVLVLACVGGAVQAMLHGLAAGASAASAAASADASAGGAPGVCGGGARRPVTVTGYVGVVYEKLADGLLLRHGADVVLANSRADAERFRAVYRGVGAGDDSVTECALPFLDGCGAPSAPPQHAPDAAGQAEGRGRPGSEGRGFTVVFAVQPSVPASRADRLYLLRRAVEHARARPEREVLIKLRSKPGEHTTHIEEQPYQRLARRLPGGLPDNCRLVYGHMGEVLGRTDLLVTVSSTAALESLHRSLPTAVLTDLGVREELGNHHFLGSGCLASWDELDAGHLPRADEEWTARQGVCAGGGLDRAFDTARERVAELAARPQLPPIEPYYTPVTAPGYLPAILHRYGLRTDGTPRAPVPGDPGGDGADGLRGVVRGAVREAARGAYRHGVQRVAPVIRRMGQL